MNAQEKRFISCREAVKVSSLHPHTLRKYADLQQIKSYKTPDGQRKYDRQSLEEFCNSVPVSSPVSQNQKHHYIYSRVSSKTQLDDLHRQTQYIQRAKPEYASYDSITDIASGINFKRKGLQTILDACVQGTIGEVVVAHRDRLCRFGFELLEYIIRKSGGFITVLDNPTSKSTEQELAEDLLSIVHVYSCRQMGKRSYRPATDKGIESETETFQDTKDANGGMGEYVPVCL